MKKIYILLLTLTISSLSFGQVIITEIADPNNGGGNGGLNLRFVELHNVGNTSVNLTDWYLQRWTNAASTPSANIISLTPIAELQSGGFAIIAASKTDFDATYSAVADIDGGTGGPADSNGDDQIALVNSSNVIVDFFGVVGEDGSFTEHEFEDGRAERKVSITAPNATWTASEWNIDNDGGAGAGALDAPTGYDPGQWGTPTCDFSLTSPSAVCDAITAGVDTYTVTINFSGGGNGTFIVTADSGTVDLSAGDPATDATGIITVTGVTEGTDVTVNVADGGICNIDYTIFSADCEPALELPLYEGFDYNVGANLEDQANWTGFFSGDNILVGGPGGLTYAGLASQTGNHISFDGGGIDNKIEFTGVTSGEVFASFIFNITDQSSITDLTDGGYFAALAESDSTFDTRVWVHPTTDPVGTTYEISITNASSGAVFAGSYNVGDNVLIVLSYAPGVGTVKGWVNPTSLGGVEPTPDFSETDATVAATIDRFIVRQDSPGETPSILFDELRIGTSFEEVTPTTLSNADFVSDAFKLYPNPSKSGFVNITSTGSETIQATVFDILGKQVINAAVSNERLDVSTLNTGVYIVKLTQGAATTTKKLIIQ